MAPTQPVLAGINLPHPSQFRAVQEIRGADSVMADGTLQTDLVQSASKYRFTLGWTGRSGADRATIGSAFGSANAGTVSFTAPDGVAYTVSREEGGTLDADSFLAQDGELYWNISMGLREA